jgi:hypothetical protein
MGLELDCDVGGSEPIYEFDSQKRGRIYFSTNWLKSINHRLVLSLTVGRQGKEARMPRRARIAVASYPHHIVQRGHNRRVVFVTDRDRLT